MIEGFGTFQTMERDILQKHKIHMFVSGISDQGTVLNGELLQGPDVIITTVGIITRFWPWWQTLKLCYTKSKDHQNTLTWCVFYGGQRNTLPALWHSTLKACFGWQLVTAEAAFRLASGVPQGLPVDPQTQSEPQSSSLKLITNLTKHATYQPIHINEQISGKTRVLSLVSFAVLSSCSFLICRIFNFIS